MSLQPSLAMTAQPAVYAGPLYAQLAARLRERIRFEDWRAGTLIPSESDLARDYGVSVGTARKALEGLEKDGWIVRKQGRGTFVTDLALMQMERLSRLRGAGDGPGFDGCIVRLTSAARGVPRRDEALDLRLARPDSSVGDVVRIRRHYFRDESSSILEDAAFPAELVPGLEASRRAPLNIFSVLVDDFSIIPHRACEVVSADIASENIATDLGVPVGAPILTTRSVVFDIDGNRVMLLIRHAHAKGMRYEVELS
jgi:GntR family transcriptional regulator